MSVKSRSQLQSEKNTSFADNTSGSITASVLRTFTGDSLDSAFNLLTDTTDSINQGSTNRFWKDKYTFLYEKVVGDNSTNLQSKLNELEAAAISEGGFAGQGQVKYTLSIGSQKVRIDNAISFNPTWVRLVGSGGELDCSNLGTGETAVYITGTDDPQRGGRACLEGIMIDGGFGNQTITGRVGLRLNCAETTINNVRIRDFETGITYESNTYLITHNDVFINRCDTAVFYPAGLTTSGENITFFGGKIADCDQAYVNEGSNISTFSFHGTSFDYNGNYRFGGAAGGTGTLHVCKMTGTGNNVQHNFTNCHFESWDYDHPPFKLTNRNLVNINNGKFLATKSPFTDLNCSSIFAIDTANQSQVNIDGMEFENSKISTTASVDVLTEGAGKLFMLRSLFKGQSPVWQSKTSGSPMFDLPVNGALVENSLRVGVNSSFTSTVTERIQTQSQTGQTADLIAHFVNAVKTAWITSAGKVFGFGLDARSQIVSNVANASASTDALPLGQADERFMPQIQSIALTTTSSGAIPLAQKWIQANTSGITLTLPSATTSGGATIGVINQSAGTVSINASAGNVEGVATYSLAAGAAKQFWSNGTNWLIVASK